MADGAYFIGGENSSLLKKALAKTLYNKDIEQSKISEILNLSQPMVSNYCSSNEKIPEKIKNLAIQISENIIRGQKPTFQTCILFSKKRYEGSFFIAEKNELISDENAKVTNNLTEAFSILKGQNINGLIPKIKINIAMGKENLTSSDDVAAFLNGLIIIDDIIIGYNGIRFGKSKHLSTLLLNLKEDIDINAIMNIAYIEDIKKTGFTIGYLTKDFKFNESEKKIDILIHKGDFGIEPCAYVLGKDAVDVVNKVIKIKEKIK